MPGPDGPDPAAELRQADAEANAESSESEDQFTDAQSAPMSPNGRESPLPTARAEKVNDNPTDSETSGNDIQEERHEDAQPDEATVIPDEGSQPVSPSIAGDTIPETVVEEAASTSQHSVAHESKLNADASPVEANEDESHDSTGTAAADESASSPSVTADNTTHQGGESSQSQALAVTTAKEDNGEDDNEAFGDEAFGDDFDDFEEGGGEDDFDFDESFAQPEPQEAAAPAPPLVQQASLPFPIPDLDGLSSDEILAATEPYQDMLFPPENLDILTFPPLSKDGSIFTTPRSASLWSQLVAPPPLAPPDWIRSRTRRLFLVSLGVPVDLDEILPASKQKKLVLPSLNIPANSPRTSTDSRSLSRLRQGEGNASSTSVDTQGKPKEKRRKGPPPPPDFDMVAARYLCTTTDEALNGMTDEEAKEHVARLEAIQVTAKEVLEYWQKRTDEKIGERETFEGVIENLVKHARKVRK